MARKNYLANTLTRLDEIKLAGKFPHRLILFDNDGTLNSQFSCWRYVQQPLGIFEPQGRNLLESHLAGEMDYEEFCIQSVKLWRGISIGELEKIINEIPLREGVIEVFTYFRKHGYRIACVSSGFDIWKSVFENMHSFVFDDYLANHLVTDSKENLTGEIIVNVTDDTPLKNKAAQLKKLCRKYRLSLEEAIAVGDGLGDIKLFEVAAVSFAVKPTHDEVEQAAHHVLESSNLTEILQYFKNGIYCPKGNRKGI